MRRPTFSIFSTGLFFLAPAAIWLLGWFRHSADTFRLLAAVGFGLAAVGWIYRSFQEHKPVEKPE